MAYEPGDLKTFNPNKEIAKEIILEILIRHRDALKQARTGELPGVSADEMDDNRRKVNQARALNRIIASQREMITISRPIIFFGSTQKWKKKYKEDSDQKEHPFSEEKNDYNTLMDWLNFIKECEMAIIIADKTASKEDDFLVTRLNREGEEVHELTKNFYDMLEDLEYTYEQVYLLMLTNKIVSAGIEEDEEMTYKEKEKEAISRVVEA